MLGKNLETKNTLEKDEIKADVAELKKEVEEGPVKDRVYIEVASAFYGFKKERRIAKEKKNAEVHLETEKPEGKVKLTSYGQTCELDLSKKKVSFKKGNSFIPLDEIPFDFDQSKFLEPGNYKYKEEFQKNLLRVFKVMDLINNAVYVSKHHRKNRKFYFEQGEKLKNTYNLKVDGEFIAGPRQFFRTGFDSYDFTSRNVFEEMLNRIVA